MGSLHFAGYSMIQIGRINRLKIKAIEPDGFQLDAGESGELFLPERDVPGKYREGDEIEVFVYADKEDLLQATTRKPYATVGEFATLQVVSNTSAGSFLHWGIGHDLLVPKGEQSHQMVEGNSYVVWIFLSEKTNRIIASSRLDKFLSPQAPDYTEGEEVDLILFEKTDLGYRALINQAHIGMLYNNEIFQPVEIGKKIKGYIKRIREDQKIDLILQQSGYQGIDGISQSILGIIQERGGKVTVTDKSPPEDIYSLFGVSKKVFKKAIGALYKKRIIHIEAGGISIVN
jgi:predicted RNA-binding protein (virulence factor B family)